MKVAVWDTYVNRKDGRVMHFDIIVPEEMTDSEQIFHYGKSYLKDKGEEGQPLSSAECQYCHIERIKPQYENSIKTLGYFILEMENCD